MPPPDWPLGARACPRPSDWPLGIPSRLCFFGITYQRGDHAMGSAASQTFIFAATVKKNKPSTKALFLSVGVVFSVTFSIDFRGSNVATDTCCTASLESSKIDLSTCCGFIFHIIILNIIIINNIFPTSTKILLFSFSCFFDYCGLDSCCCAQSTQLVSLWGLGRPVARSISERGAGWQVCRRCPEARRRLATDPRHRTVPSKRARKDL